MTEEQKRLYNELHRKSSAQVTSMSNFDKTMRYLVSKDYANVYDSISNAIDDIDARIEQLNSVKETLIEIKSSGKPLKEIKMNKAVECSYTSPISNMVCSSCIHACSIRLVDEDDVTTEYMVCNINDQAYSAHVEGHSHGALIDVFGVHPEGRCKFQQPLGDDEQPVDFDEYVANKDQADSEEPIIIPPEAPGGFVDEEHMEP